MCSPGCFSLLRASALLDDHVLSIYATRSSEAKHLVQYDQGEDRWLSTLLVQQGYYIAYCSAACSKTYAPETFHEYYNQRRRWVIISFDSKSNFLFLNLCLILFDFIE
jgi:chitin synthase